MRNNVGLYTLFGDNIKAKKLFAEWCKNNDGLCDYDLEHILVDLSIPTINNTDRYFHFHKGNILDWLEEQGYYIGVPLRGKFKYVTVVHKNEKGNVSQKPLYSNSGVRGRNRALELGVQKSIEDLEKQLTKTE